MVASYKINGAVIKRPSDFKISRYKLTKSSRLADGSLTADVIASKRKFFFTYAAIDSTDLDKILDLVWENDGFFFDLEYVENNATKTANVYVGEIPTQLHRTGGVWVWKDVTMNFIER